MAEPLKLLAGIRGEVRGGLRWLNRRRSLVTLIQAARRVIPGDSSFGDPMSTAGSSPAHLIGRRAGSLSDSRLSLLGEFALAGLQLADWLGEDLRGPASGDEVSILFADLRGFSDWAITVGDDRTAELLRSADAEITDAVESRDGVVVKRLGDGTMAIFGDCPTAVEAAFDAIAAVGRISVNGYEPKLRAGIHLGRPQRIGSDYVGVDVNIAARLCQAAPGNGVLISDPVRERAGDGLRTAPVPEAHLHGVPPEVSIYMAAQPSSGDPDDGADHPP